MKAIRSATILENVLVEELAWRKKELITLKTMHDGAREHQQTMLRRAGIALLYAHWEGFVKASGTAYVDLVARQNLRYRDLTCNFVAIAAKKELHQFSSTTRGRMLCCISDFFINKLGQPARLSSTNAIQTKSNLSVEVTRDILCLLGLDYKPFEIHERTVIEPLVRSRNSVAHGERRSIDTVDYDTLHRKVLELLDELKDQLCTAAHGRMYRAVARQAGSVSGHQEGDPTGA
jgi:hypothetical protein